MLKLVIAGGGTGGHIFPAISIINAISQYVETKILWIGTGKELERQILKEFNFNYITANVKPLKNNALINKLYVLACLPYNIINLMKYIRDFAPDIVLGVGGYVSGPVILASKLLGIKTAIHEQNVKPGLANKLASYFSDIIFISFEDTKKYFKHKNVIYSGNPVRKEILLAKISKNQDTFHILILGGSQGASSLNKIISEALLLINKKGLNITFTHQTGKKDYLELKNFYEKHNIPVKVVDFIHDMGSSYAEADLIISRAGATTISEILATGKPSILIPYPYATDSHQEENAKKLTELGAAVYFNQNTLTPDILEKQIIDFYLNRNKLTEMSKKAYMLSKKDSDIIIAKHLIELTKFKDITCFKTIDAYTN